MSTSDGQRVSGLRTEIFYIVVIVSVALIVAFFVGVSYQATTTMIVEANEQTNIALGVISSHGPSSNKEIKDLHRTSTTSTSTIGQGGAAEQSTFVDVTKGVDVEIEQ